LGGRAGAQQAAAGARGKETVAKMMRDKPCSMNTRFAHVNVDTHALLPADANTDRHEGCACACARAPAPSLPVQ
jgi:hypothetical protein